MGRKAREKRQRVEPAERRSTGPPPAPHARPQPGSARRRAILCCLLLVALGVAAYANSLRVPFILDDGLHIVKAPAIRPPLSLEKILGTDRPFVTASLALNYQLGGLEVFGYHLLNLVAHLACALLVFAFTRSTLRLPALRDRFGSRADGLAAIVAAVFLLHPIQTESVTYVIQRGEILGTLAMLGSVWLAAGAVQAARPAPQILGLLGVGVLGVLSKQSVVVTPFLFALYDWCFLLARADVRARGRRAAVYGVLAALALGAALWGWQHADEPTAGFQMETIRPGRYLTWQFGVVLYYLRLVLVPDRLCFDCGYMGPWPVVRSTLGDMVWVPALVLGAGAAAAALARARLPLVTFGVLGSMIVLAPTSSFMPLADVYVEHRLYLPIALLAMAAVPSLCEAGDALVHAGWLGSRAVRAVGLAASAAVCGLLAYLTVARNHVYQDVLRLRLDSVAKAPENSRLQYDVGNAYMRSSQPELAIPYFLEAARLEPTSSRSYVNLGNVYSRLGRHGEAAEAFEAAIARAPTLGLAHRNLTLALERLGRIPEAVAAAERAVAVEPHNLLGRKQLAGLYVRTGRQQDALREYREAARLAPRDAEVQRDMAALAAGSR